MTLDIAPVLDEPLDWRVKSFPPSRDDQVVRVGDVGAKKWHALAGDLVFPVLLIKESILQGNIQLLARWCRERDVSLAPHVKTPVAPQIASRQLAAGAWALSVATIHQAIVMRRLGVTRLLMANQVLDASALCWIASELSADPGFDFMCLVDSSLGVDLMDEVLKACGFHGRLGVLLEVGAPGGRCGCRSQEEAQAVAVRVANSSHLFLRGVEVYENVFEIEPLKQRLQLIDATLERVRSVVDILDRDDLFGHTQELIVSGGGSLYFDQVVERLGKHWTTRLRVRLVLRCGSYITQDDGAYEQLSPLAGRAPVGSELDRLGQALEVWGMVLSRPEAELAVVGLGKRDVAHDRALPRPFAVKLRGQSIIDSEGIAVISLNDHHARLRVGKARTLRPGDLVGFRIAHPCTTFDNWRFVPMVDDNYIVSDVIRCYL